MSWFDEAAHNCLKTLGPDWYEILGAHADTDIREQENSKIRYISHIVSK